MAPMAKSSVFIWVLNKCCLCWQFIHLFNKYLWSVCYEPETSLFSQDEMWGCIEQTSTLTPQTLLRKEEGRWYIPGLLSLLHKRKAETHWKQLASTEGEKWSLSPDSAEVISTDIICVVMAVLVWVLCLSFHETLTILLHLRKQKHREVKVLPQSHTAGGW